MTRWLRLLIALAIAGVAGFALFAFTVVMGYGVMWLFIFGDSSWPPAAETFAEYGLTSIGLLLGLAVAITIFRTVWKSGPR